MVFTFVFAVELGISWECFEWDPVNWEQVLSIRLNSRLLDLECQRSLLSEELEAQDSASYLEHLPSVVLEFDDISHLHKRSESGVKSKPFDGCARGPEETRSFCPSEKGSIP